MSSSRSQRRLRPVLLVGPGGDAEACKEELGARFAVQTARTTAAAAALLGSKPIDAVVVAPDAPAGWIDALLEAIERLRPGLLLLAIRPRSAAEPPSWQARGVGVLRQPLLPDALVRSLHAALALQKP